jgi:transposase
MEKYFVRLTDEEREDLEKLIQKGGKGYRIKHAQILLKLDQRIENSGWTYERIKAAYNVSNGTVAGVAKRFVFDGMEAALGRKKREYNPIKVTGEVEARICLIACSDPPAGRSRWTMKLIAEELIRLEIVDYISDSTVCETLKKTKLNLGKSSNGVYPKQAQNL